MRLIVAYSIILRVVFGADSGEYENVTLLFQPADRQLFEFKVKHPTSIGLMTTTSGEPMDLRKMIAKNSEPTNMIFPVIAENIPERTIFAKGAGAFGYFEVTHDVSKYTYADVFKGVGKRTALFVRFSTMFSNLGGTDLTRGCKGMAVKFYTRQGNLDMLGYSLPVSGARDPIWFSSLVTHAFQRNPKTNLYDMSAFWDVATQLPILFHFIFWSLADYGSPASYRNIDSFPIYTYELVNGHGETHYARFNFRTEQGFSSLTNAEAAAIQGIDLDYFSRDLYNNIEDKRFPAWRLEMDVMTKHDLLKVDYDPFDVTRLWKNGTFFTVQIGRLVLNRNADNFFRDVEQAAFNPGNLVPGIPGPIDQLSKNVYSFYQDAQNYRLGRNHDNILVNMPLYAKTYNRDGKPPTWVNGNDAPNYYPNSFNGAMPYVDEKKPKAKLVTLESNAVDLEPAWYFYNYILNNEAKKQRFIDNLAQTLVPVTSPVLPRVLKLLQLIDHDLESRVRAALVIARAVATAPRIPFPTTSPTPNLVNHEAGYKH